MSKYLTLLLMVCWLGAFAAGGRATSNLSTQSMPAIPSAEALISQARDDMARGEFDRAHDAAVRALQMAPERDDIRFLVLQTMQGSRPNQALAVARTLAERRPGDATLQLALADTLLDASVAVPPLVRHRLLGEASAALARAQRMGLPPELRGEAIGCSGLISFLRGDLRTARDTLLRALRAGITSEERAADIANAAAWTSFLLGDADGCARLQRRALASVIRLPPSGGGWTPRWEYFNFYLEAFAGVPVRTTRLQARAPYYESLRIRGIEPQADFEDSRTFLLRLQELREAGRWEKAIELVRSEISWEARDVLAAGDSEPSDADDDEAEEEGEERADRLRPRTVHRWLADSQDAVLCRLLLADMYARIGDERAALGWMRSALQTVPGNRILKSRLERLQHKSPGDRPGAGPKKPG